MQAVIEIKVSVIDGVNETLAGFKNRCGLQELWSGTQVHFRFVPTRGQ